MKSLMNSKQTAEYIEISLSTFYRIKKDSSFPKGVKVLKTTKWSKEQIDEWIKSKSKP